MRLAPTALAAAIVLCATTVMPRALALEKERTAKLRPGETALLWSGANYGRRCRTAGPPIFRLVSAPALGEVSADEAPYVVPRGEHCAGNSYTGLRVWYKAGKATGIDTFSYTLEFPHEPSNPQPSKGPRPVAATITIE